MIEKVKQEYLKWCKENEVIYIQVVDISIGKTHVQLFDKNGCFLFSWNHKEDKIS